MSFSAYPEYKDSGIEWLGDVPVSWELARGDSKISSVSKIVEASELNDQEIFHYSIPVVQETGNGQLEAGDEIQSSKLLVEHKQVLISKLNPRKNTVCIACPTDVMTVCSGEFVPLQSDVVDLKWLFYLVGSENFRKRLESLVESATRSHQRVNPRDILKFQGAFPPAAEQTQIAQFLDHETARIDALIEQQQRLIELLKEKRQAVISHAVTKGLDPSVPMKDSGVEWLGEVPAHWEVKRLKHLCSDIKAGPFGSALTKDMYVVSGYKVYGQEQVIPSDFSLGDYYISADYFSSLKQYEALPGDILISCVGTFGKIAVVPESIEPGIINPRLIRVRVNELVDANFLAVVLRSKVVFEQFSLLSRGGTMDVINIGTLSDIHLALPPLDEQIDVLSFIDGQESKIDRLVHQASVGVELLTERRSALISAAVTGKIDVRNWKSSAPESEQESQQEVAHG